MAGELAHTTMVGTVKFINYATTTQLSYTRLISSRWFVYTSHRVPQILKIILSTVYIILWIVHVRHSLCHTGHSAVSDVLLDYRENLSDRRSTAACAILLW